MRRRWAFEPALIALFLLLVAPVLTAREASPSTLDVGGGGTALRNHLLVAVPRRPAQPGVFTDVVRRLVRALDREVVGEVIPTSYGTKVHRDGGRFPFDQAQNRIGAYIQRRDSDAPAKPDLATALRGAVADAMITGASGGRVTVVMFAALDTDHRARTLLQIVEDAGMSSVATAVGHAIDLPVILVDLSKESNRPAGLEITNTGPVTLLLGSASETGAVVEEILRRIRAAGPLMQADVASVSPDRTETLADPRAEPSSLPIAGALALISASGIVAVLFLIRRRRRASRAPVESNAPRAVGRLAPAATPRRHVRVTTIQNGIENYYLLLAPAAGQSSAHEIPGDPLIEVHALPTGTAQLVIADGRAFIGGRIAEIPVRIGRHTLLPLDLHPLPQGEFASIGNALKIKVDFVIPQVVPPPAHTYGPPETLAILEPARRPS